MQVVRRVCFVFGVAFLSFCRAQAPTPPPVAAPPVVAPPATPPAVPQPPQSPSGPPPLTFQDLETFFDGILPLQLERSDIAGASVLVMKDGNILLLKGYGYADVKTKKPVDP